MPTSFQRVLPPGLGRAEVMMHAIPDAPARGSAWPALDDLVTRLRAARRRIAAAQAEEAAVLAAAVELVAERVAVSRQEAQQQGRTLRMGDADLPVREVCLELGMAIRASDRGVQRRMSDAHQLKTSFSRTHAAWAAGEIDAGHAWAISRTGTMLTGDEDRARFEDRALEVARSESPTRAAPAITAIAASIDPAAFEQSARRGFDERSVRLFDLDDGMARLIADLPAPLAHAIHDALTTRARAILDREPEAEADAATPRAHADPDGGHDADEDAVVTGDGRGTGPGTGGRTGSRHGADARTLAQVRADVFSDLVLTGRPTTRATGDGLEAVAARIHVTIPALTLAGDPTGGPALLAGYGPIATSLARRLAGLAPGWDRIFTDPHTGEVRAVDRYRPSAELRRYLTARDEHCRTPGCTRPAQRCDIDHTTAAAQGGATAHDNLAHLCRRHHTTKHHTAWRVRHLGNGTLEWTSPAGHHYRDRPAATVRFVPTAEDPPPF